MITRDEIIAGMIAWLQTDNLIREQHPEIKGEDCRRCLFAGTLVTDDAYHPGNYPSSSRDLQVCSNLAV